MVGPGVKAAVVLILALVAHFAFQRCDPHLITISSSGELDLKDVQSPVRILSISTRMLHKGIHPSGSGGIRLVPFRGPHSFPAYWKLDCLEDQK
jgi:hypothetical protein